MAPALPINLATLPDLVTPKILAILLGVKTTTIHQRIWRQKQQPNSTLLPKIVHIPGCNRVVFTRESVIDWWLAAQQPTTRLIKCRRAGRPTKSYELAKLGAQNG